MTERHDPHDPTRPAPGDEQSTSTAMTIDIDPAFAPLATELQQQIHAEAGRVTPRRPSVDQLLRSPRRPGTNHATRFRLALAAAAVLLVLLGALALRPRPGGSDVEMRNDPMPVVPWRVGLDPSSQYLLTDAYDDAAVQNRASGSGSVPGSTRGSGEQTALTSYARSYRSAAAGTTPAPPWMLVTVLAYPDGQAPIGNRGGGTPLTVGTREGWRYAEATSTGHFGFLLDARHEVDVKRWGVSEADAVGAASSIRLVEGPDGFELDAPPAGLIGRDQSAGSVQDIERAGYSLQPDGNASTTHLDLEIRHTTQDATDLAITVLLGQSSSTPLDQAEIQSVPFPGGTALVRVASSNISGTTVLATWADPAHERVGLLRLSGPLAGGAVTEVTRVLSSLHDIDDAAWQELVRRCPGIRTGTVPSTAVGSC